MRYLVEVTLKQPPTPEILSLLPAETAHGQQFDESGVREALFVAQREVKAWQIYRADSQAEVERIVESFPLTKFCNVSISELRELG
jgi:muconolactone delta-isomerase